MKFILCVLLFFSFSSYSQLLRDNEETIFSFKTYNGKTVLLAKDKANQYIIYRFGTDDKIELEFPSKDAESWKKFTYNFYLRGGGKQNLGVDIDNIKFTNNGFEYVIFSSYSAGDENEEESYSIGIIIRDKNNKETRIIGNPETQIGSLQSFRTDSLVEIDQEMELEQ